jgi:aspartokinase-like uncharacterized kinase
VRDVFQRYGLSESLAHALCVQAMTITGQVLVELVPQAVLETSWQRLREWIGGSPHVAETRVLQVQEFL